MNRTRAKEEIRRRVETATERGEAINEVRRRMQAASDPRDRIYWKLIERMIETNSSLDHFGYEIDETGEAWSYCISVKNMLAEPFSGYLPLIRISKVTGSMEHLIRFNEIRNQTVKIDSQQKEVCTDRICEAVLIK